MSQKFLENLEDVLTSPRTPTIVKERFMEVLGAVVYACGSGGSKCPSRLLTTVAPLQLQFRRVILKTICFLVQRSRMLGQPPVVSANSGIGLSPQAILKR